MNFEILLTILMGIGLSAASGFRIFIPFFVVSIASLTGNLDSFGVFQLDWDSSGSNNI